MKNKSFTITFILMFLLSTFIGGCSLKTEAYNIVVTNNSGGGFKSVGFYKEHSSGGVSNADNSLIEAGQTLKTYMESNQFTLRVIDAYDNEYTSQKFDVDFQANKNKIYKISIEKDSFGNLKYILNE